MLLSRIIVSYTALVLVAVTASAMAEAQATGPGPLERRANPETPENPVPRRTRFVAPEIPTARYSPLIVELRVTLDERGGG